MTTCACAAWQHQIFDGCPPPPPPRPCCGTTNWKQDFERRCENNQCVMWFCPCGTYTGMAAGPVLCGCRSDRGCGRFGSWPRWSVPNGREHHRRYRRRTRRRT